MPIGPCPTVVDVKVELTHAVMLVATPRPTGPATEATTADEVVDSAGRHQSLDTGRG